MQLDEEAQQSEIGVGVSDWPVTALKCKYMCI